VTRIEFSDETCQNNPTKENKNQEKEKEEDELSKALGQILTSESIRVQRNFLFKNLAIFISKSSRRRTHSNEKGLDETTEKQGVELLHVQEFRIQLEIPLLLRWLQAMPWLIPIPKEMRKGEAQFVTSSTWKISLND